VAALPNLMVAAIMVSPLLLELTVPLTVKRCCAAVCNAGTSNRQVTNDKIPFIMKTYLSSVTWLVQMACNISGYRYKTISLVTVNIFMTSRYMSIVAKGSIEPRLVNVLVSASSFQQV
jgi:hypothetical protein